MQKMGIHIFVEGAQPTIIARLAEFVTVIVCLLQQLQALGVQNKTWWSWPLSSNSAVFKTLMLSDVVLFDWSFDIGESRLPCEFHTFIYKAL